jgi:hypothetical protein
VRRFESAIPGVMLACLAACGGNHDPNTKQKTELSPAPEDSAAAHTLPATAVAEAQAAAADPAAPGFAGVWAADPAQCRDFKQTYQFSAARIEMGAKRGCAVTSISEEHPSGRSMIYHVGGACIGKTASNDAITFTFGPSDTVMQARVNDEPPERLVRCPPH